MAEPCVAKTLRIDPNLSYPPSQVLKYENELMSLIHLLHEKALSKRGYSWTGKLISSLLLTLTHTYPLENKFTNPDEWSSEGMLNGQSPFLHIDDTFNRVSKESSPPLGEALQSRRD